MEINFPSYNWLDLSCVPLDQGCIRPGKLIRAASLDEFPLEAWERVQEQIPVSLVVDLRTPGEVPESPLVFAAASKKACAHTCYVNLPLEGMLFLMNERTQPSPKRRDWEKTRKKLWNDPTVHLPEMYSKMVLAPKNIASWKSFFLLAAMPRQGALLWHCAQGTDRTGITAMLLLEALGAPRAAIFENYLACYAHATKPDVARRALQAAYEAIEQNSGSVGTYLQNQLGVGADQRQTLRALYVSGC